jgi:hypothetical protein
VVTHFAAVAAELDREIAHHLTRRPLCPWTDARLVTLVQIRGWLTEALAETGDGGLALAMVRSAVTDVLLEMTHPSASAASGNVRGVRSAPDQGNLALASLEPPD